MDHVPPQHQHDADGSHGDERATLSRLLLLGLALLGAIGFAALGVWQVERRAWKLDLIARVESRIHAAPVAIPAPARWGSVAGPSHAYRRVRATGIFLHDRETLVQAVTQYGAGAWVLTPLRTAASVVLVNRGFVPDSRRDPATRRSGQVEGPVTVTGLLRMSEPSGAFLRSNDAGANRWFSRDVAAIAAARGLDGVAPFFVDADAAPNPGGYPVGGLTVVAFRNNHLVYALTWFGLAGLCAFAALLLLRKRQPD
jgi:surfeit locus 1 family protein